MEMIENGQNKAGSSGVYRCQITTYDKESEILRGNERCRNFRNLYLLLTGRPSSIGETDLVQADVGATKWVALPCFARTATVCLNSAFSRHFSTFYGPSV